MRDDAENEKMYGDEFFSDLLQPERMEDDLNSFKDRAFRVNVRNIWDTPTEFDILHE
jgi:hypothetical protein